MSEKIECEWCGVSFKNIKNHKCKIKEAAGGEQAEEEEKSKGKELEVRGSATKGVIPDRFWAWAEGFSLQMRTLIDLMTDLRNNAGNTYKEIRKLVESNHALNEGFADVLDFIKWNKNRLTNVTKDIKERLKQIDNGEEEIPETPPSPPATSNDSMESYKENEALPEHTRKLPAKIKIATPKALFLEFFNGKEAWCPKSTVKGEYDEDNKGDDATDQDFIIDSWILKKNKVIDADE